MRSRIPEAEVPDHEARIVRVAYLVDVHQVEGHRAVLQSGEAQVGRGVLDVAPFRWARKLETIAVSPERLTYSAENNLFIIYILITNNI